jgi:hypothetical protein
MARYPTLTFVNLIKVRVGPDSCGQIVAVSRVGLTAIGVTGQLKPETLSSPRSADRKMEVC